MLSKLLVISLWGLVLWFSFLGIWLAAQVWHEYNQPYRKPKKRK